MPQNPECAAKFKLREHRPPTAAEFRLFYTEAKQNTALSLSRGGVYCILAMKAAYTAEKVFL